MDETGKVRTAKVIIGFLFGINLTPSQNLGKLFFFSNRRVKKQNTPKQKHNKNVKRKKTK